MGTATGSEDPSGWPVRSNLGGCSVASNGSADLQKIQYVPSDGTSISGGRILEANDWFAGRFPEEEGQRRP